MVHDAPQTNTAPKPDSGIISQDGEAAQWSPETVLDQLSSRPEANSHSPLPFFHILERLKTTKREGWRRFGINHGESISDHMYRMSILTMFAPPSLASRINIQHCTRMALVHDMAEAIVGDITPIDPVSKEEKSRRETVTMDYLCNNLLGCVGGGLTGQDIRKLWQEYEDSETLESKYVHDIDKMELLLQMMEYERSQEGRLDIGEFTWVATKIVLPEIKEWADQVFEERRQFWIKVGKEPSWGASRR